MKKIHTLLTLGAMIALACYAAVPNAAADDLPDRDASIALAPDISDHYVFSIQKPADIVYAHRGEDAVISLSAASYVEKNPANQAIGDASSYGTLKKQTSTYGTGVIDDTSTNLAKTSITGDLVYYDSSHTSTGLASLGNNTAPKVFQTS